MENFRQLLKNTKSQFLRYSYHQINWDARMIGITGPRGAGKTTMILQYIRNNLKVRDTLYVTTEDFYFADNRLSDLAKAFVRFGGKYLFVDEIHRYKNWSTELKLIYDYHPDLKIVFTGSSVLDIKKGASDLSRRATMYHMQGLSFREYLQLFHNIKSRPYSLEEIIAHQVKLPDLDLPLLYFKNYLEKGYYPFASDKDYKIKLRQIIDQTLETDIPFYADMNVSTGRKIKQLLAIISKSVPFKPNFSKIAEILSVSRNSMTDYLMYLEEAGMIFQLRRKTAGIRGLGKVDKVFLDNTNLMFNLADISSNIGNVRETFFLNQLRINSEVYASHIADFEINDLTFEVGGKSKTQKQIADLNNAYIVKDDIEYGFGNTIPLWHFGMTY